MSIDRRSRMLVLLAVVAGAAMLADSAFGQAAQSESFPDHIIEQYKIYLTDLGQVGAQFALAQTFFLTMITALVALFAFKEKRQAGHYSSPEAILVFFLIAVVCLTSWLTAQEYLILISAKFKVLKEIEAAFPALHPMFTNQTTYYLGGEGWMRGIIRKQSLLELVVGVAAFVLAVAGLIRRRKKVRRRPRSRARPRSA